MAKAEQFSRETEGIVRPLCMNIHEPIHPHQLEHVKLVIMCLDQTDSTFVRTCIQSGVHYMDVTANGSFLTAVEHGGAEAEAQGATAITMDIIDRHNAMYYAITTKC